MTDSMRAVGSRENLPADDPSSLVDLRMPIPAPGPHDLLVRIHAASVNPIDTKIRRFSRTQDGELRILGFDAAGTVVAVGGAQAAPSTLEATMDADLDVLLTTVFVTADDLLAERHSNAARRVTDTEDFTLCVAQAVMGSRPTGGFSPSLPSTFGTCFDSCSSSRGTSGRRRRLADTLDWLMGIFASQSPGFYDDLLVVDSTTVECARSRPPAGHRPGHFRHMTGWPDPDALIRRGFLGRGNRGSRVTGEIVVTDRRFRGPPGSGQSGYTCGLLLCEIPRCRGGIAAYTAAT